MNKVVVVEDDVLLAKMYVRLLEFEGFAVVTVNDGEEAINTITREQPDLVLMDIMMPKMNGLQALEAIKQAPETKPIPVVVMSNLANVNDTQEVLDKGAIQYIDKSKYDPKSIAQLAKEVLSGQTSVPEIHSAQNTSASSQSAEKGKTAPPTVAKESEKQPSLQTKRYTTGGGKLKLPQN